MLFYEYIISKEGSLKDPVATTKSLNRKRYQMALKLKVHQALPKEIRNKIEDAVWTATNFRDIGICRLGLTTNKKLEHNELDYLSKFIVAYIQSNESWFTYATFKKGVQESLFNKEDIYSNFSFVGEIF